jgi:hypothetical protein
MNQFIIVSDRDVGLCGNPVRVGQQGHFPGKASNFNGTGRHHLLVETSIGTMVPPELLPSKLVETTYTQSPDESATTVLGYVNFAGSGLGALVMLSHPEDETSVAIPRTQTKTNPWTPRKVRFNITSRPPFAFYNRPSAA